MESEELPSTSKENVQTRKNSAINMHKAQDKQKKKRIFSQRHVSCTLSDLKTWPIFYVLDKEFISKIHMFTIFENDSALIISKDKMVYNLGINYKNKLELNKDYIQPEKVEELCGKNIKTFYSNINIDCFFALTEEGEVYSWGSNKYCTLGRELDSHVKRFYMPGKIDSLSEECTIDIATNNYNILALTDNGKVYIWGSIEFSNIRFKSQLYEVKFELGTKILHIACGKNFIMALSEDRKLYSWGLNNSGQLGLNLSTWQKRKNPCLIASLTDITIVKIACGFHHSLALTSQGVIYSWGSNIDGQLGLGKETKLRLGPVMLDVPAMGEVSDIAAQDNKSIAVNKIGCVYIWGHHVRWQIIWMPVRSAYSNMYDMFRYNISYIVHDSTEEKPNMLQYLEAFNDRLTSDLTIKIEGKLIYVHKVILKIRCQYFRNMFQSGRTEGNPNVIEHNDFSYNVYKIFLKYLYTDMVDHLPLEEAIELLELCRKYNETDLRRKCIQTIRENITVSNVVFCYTKAIEYNAKDLEEFCFEYAFCHITDVIKSDAFAKLIENKILLDFMVKIAEAGIFKT